MNYLIESSSETQTVKLWSTRRLPFEPKGWLKDMREDLKNELKMRLRKNSDEFLYAVYQSSSNESGYDLENILFYNVGNGSFSHLNLTEICFEKKFGFIPFPSIELEQSPSSFSLYKMETKGNFNPFWKKNQVLAAWENIHIISFHSAYSFWSAMRQGYIETYNNTGTTAEFGIEISLSLPENMRFSLPSDAMKKLLDGVICAFHVHNGLHETDVANRLEQKLPYNSQIIKCMLQDGSTNILGKRSIFNLRANYLICNPADDKCAFVRIRVSTTKSSQCLMSGKLITVKHEEYSE